MKCRVLALAGVQLALAGCVYEAGLVISGRAGSPVVDEVAGSYCPSGDVQPPSFPLLGGSGWLAGGQQVVPAEQALPVLPGQQAQGRQLTLHPALAPAPAAGDPHLAERLVTNLVDNALRHNVPGGSVEVVTGVRGFRSFLSVTNTGPEVPAQEVDRLLQPFHRLGTERTRHGEGLGLGLSIVHAIAQAHGADLAIRPQPGGGLQAEVSFPVPGPGHMPSRSPSPQRTLLAHPLPRRPAC